MAKKNAPVEQDNLGFDSVEQTLTKTEQFLREQMPNKLVLLLE